MPEGVIVRRIASVVLVLALILSGFVFIAPAAMGAFPPPQADAGPDQTVEEGEEVTLDGGGSRDLTPDENLRFYWDLDASNGSSDRDAVGEVVTVKYKDSGVYTVTLTVDDGDFEDTDTCRITVLPTSVDNTPPKAIIRAPLPGFYNLSQAISFNGDGYDYDGDPLTGKWDFGDGTTSNRPETTHSYSDEGAKYIRWTVSDRDSNNTARTVIYIGESPAPEENRRPEADLNASDTEVTVGEEIRFSAEDSSDPDDDELNFEWDFDLSDGLDTDSTEEVVLWSYNETGEYQVTLQVRDDQRGGIDIAMETITVTERPNDDPEVNAGNDAEVQVGVPLSFRGTATDPDGDNITLYMWDFGDGSTWESDENGRTNHTYREPGTYTATFSAEDERGATGSDTRMITVNPPPDMPPVAKAGEDISAMEGDTVFFQGRGTDDFGIAKYEWDFNSDNVWDFESPTSGDATFIYNTPGIYTAILRVTDSPRPGVSGPGQTDEDSVIVTIGENQRPEAKIVVTTLFVQTGELVRFKSDSTDPEGARLTYAWDLDGDGQVDSNAANPSWTYKRGGSYQVTLTVTDDFGQSDTDQVNMEVTQTHSVTLDIASALRDLDPGESHDFRATISNDGNGDDQFRITLTGKNSNWATVDTSLVDLSATEKLTVTIRVTAPSSALSTDDALITVTASSNYGSASDADDIEVGIKQSFALKVEIDTSSITIKQGENKEDFATITVTNEGNGPDTIRVSFSGDITGYLRTATPKVDLAPGETRSISLSITVVETAPDGKFTGSILVASTKSPAKRTLDFEVTIEGETDGDSIFQLDTNTMYILVGVVVVIVVVIYFASSASRKRRPGNSRKATKG
jgi:PKD repeat protein